MTTLILPSSNLIGTRFHYDVLLDDTHPDEPDWIYSADWTADPRGTDESDVDFSARLNAYQAAIEVDLGRHAAALLAAKTGEGSVPLADEGGRELETPITTDPGRPTAPGRPTLVQ
jgi:hypothetical protein